MNKNKILLFFLALAVAGGALFAEEKSTPGPNGGLILKSDSRAEFFVTEDRKVMITFLDAELKPLDPEERQVRVTALAPSGRKSIALERREDVFVSTDALPEGDGFTVVAQIFQDPKGRPQNFRIVYEEHICGECDLREYACICGH